MLTAQKEIAKELGKHETITREDCRGDWCITWRG